MDRNPRVGKRVQNADLILRGQRRVNENRFGGVTDARTAGLAVNHQRNRLVDIGGSIDVDVAVTGTGLNGRHRCLRHDGLNQTGTAARNHYVNQAAGSDEILHGIVGLTRQQLNKVLRCIVVGQHLTQNRDQLRVGVDGGLGATQQGHVARLQRQTKGIDSNVRASLVDHAHHAQRNADLGELNAVGKSASTQHLAYRIRQCRNLTKPTGNTLNTIGVKTQAIQQGVTKTTGLTGLDILGVGHQNLFSTGNQRICCGQQELVLACRRKARQLSRDSLGTLCLI